MGNGGNVVARCGGQRIVYGKSFARCVWPKALAGTNESRCNEDGTLEVDQDLKARFPDANGRLYHVNNKRRTPIFLISADAKMVLGTSLTDWKRKKKFSNLQTPSIGALTAERL